MTSAMVYAAERLRWWAEPEETAHEALARALDTIRNRPATIERRKQFLLYASLYGNLPVLGFGLNSYTRSHARSALAAPQRIVLNATQNAIDALTAKVSKNRPRPTFTTIDADYDMRERAEAKGRFVDGQLYATDFYAKSIGVILDACIYGTGVLKVFEDLDKDDVGLERVYPWELMVDEREALYGTPRTLYQRKYYDRTVLMELYARDEDGLDDDEKRRRDALRDTIESAGRTDIDEDDFDYDATTDQILVYEGWHLRSGPKADDGRHVVAVRGAVLQYEEWKEDRFPFAFLRPMPSPYGFWAQGICEKVAGLQSEVNRIVRDIQASMHLIAKPHWMIENSSKVVPAHLDNDLATLIRYSGAVPPTVYTPQAMSADVYAHLQFLYRSIYEISGISQLSAQSQLPPGLQGASGVAMRTYLHNESERFTDFTRAYEGLAKDVAELLIAVARKIAKRRRGYFVRAIGKGSYQDIRWADVDLGDRYAIQVFPTSMLPTTPAGKLAFVEQMTSAGWLQADDALELIDWPDTDAYTKRRTAPRRIVERNIAAMKRGIEVTPEPNDPHGLALKLVNEAYHEARLDGVPDDRLELMRNYMALSVHLQQLQSPPAVSSGAASGPAPAPGPAGPPVGPGPGALPPPMPPAAGAPGGMLQ